MSWRHRRSSTRPWTLSRRRRHRMVHPIHTYIYTYTRIHIETLFVYFQTTTSYQHFNIRLQLFIYALLFSHSYNHTYLNKYIHTYVTGRRITNLQQEIALVVSQIAEKTLYLRNMHPRYSTYITYVFHY